MHQNKNTNEHVPVLLEQVLNCLEPKEGETYLDLTAGYGGHAEKVLERTQNSAGCVLVDRDPDAVEALKKRFRGQGVEIINDDFLSASRKLEEQERKFDLLLADLGASSPYFNIAKRGFSLNKEGPLDMRMDQAADLTAGDIVNTYSENEIKALLADYGEEPKAGQIAHLIVSHRPIETTTQLANIVAKAWPGYHKIHPATRTFQALRIAVNDELNQLQQSLPIWIDLLSPGGRLAVISFHSLEDRIVKQAFAERSGGAYDAELKLLTKHPIAADENEVAFNPRARSAKLRAAAKIKKKGSLHANSG